MSRKNEIIKIKTEINAFGHRKSRENKQTKRWFFEKINTNEKPLARLIKKEKESANAGPRLLVPLRQNQSSMHPGKFLFLSACLPVTCEPVTKL